MSGSSSTSTITAPPLTPRSIVRKAQLAQPSPPPPPPPPSLSPSTQEPAKGTAKPKSKSLLSFLTLKEPSLQALEKYEQEQKQKVAAAASPRRPRTAALAGVPTTKMPASVPKVNSKWDGMPKHHPQSTDARVGERDHDTLSVMSASWAGRPRSRWAPRRPASSSASSSSTNTAPSRARSHGRETSGRSSAEADLDLIEKLARGYNRAPPRGKPYSHVWADGGRRAAPPASLLQPRSVPGTSASSLSEYPSGASSPTSLGPGMLRWSARGPSVEVLRLNGRTASAASQSMQSLPMSQMSGYSSDFELASLAPSNDFHGLSPRPAAPRSVPQISPSRPSTSSPRGAASEGQAPTASSFVITAYLGHDSSSASSEDNMLSPPKALLFSELPGKGGMHPSVSVTAVGVRPASADTAPSTVDRDRAAIRAQSAQPLQVPTKAPPDANITSVPESPSGWRRIWRRMRLAHAEK